MAHCFLQGPRLAGARTPRPWTLTLAPATRRSSVSSPCWLDCGWHSRAPVGETRAAYLQASRYSDQSERHLGERYVGCRSRGRAPSGVGVVFRGSVQHRGSPDASTHPLHLGRSGRGPKGPPHPSLARGRRRPSPGALPPRLREQPPPAPGRRGGSHRRHTGTLNYLEYVDNGATGRQRGRCLPSRHGMGRPNCLFAFRIVGGSVGAASPPSAQGIAVWRLLGESGASGGGTARGGGRRLRPRRFTEGTPPRPTPCRRPCLCRTPNLGLSRRGPGDAASRGAAAERSGPRGNGRTPRSCARRPSSVPP